MKAFAAEPAVFGVCSKPPPRPPANTSVCSILAKPRSLFVPESSQLVSLAVESGVMAWL